MKQNILEIIGGILGIVQFFIPILDIWIRIGIFVFIVIVICLWIFREKIFSTWNRLKLITGEEQLKVHVKDLIKDSRHIVFCGNAPDWLLTELYSSFGEQSGEEQKSIQIYNSDSICLTTNKNIYSDLINEDAKNPDEKFCYKFYLYMQNISVLQGENSGKFRAIIFPSPRSGTVFHYGVYIKNTPAPFLHGDILQQNPIACLNILEQRRYLVQVVQNSAKLLEPLRKGWCQPILPPLDDVDILKIWRNKILHWFNSTAVAYLGGAPNRPGIRFIKISWIIRGKQAIDEAREFEEWLLALRKEAYQEKRIWVVRYMIIDFNSYKTDAEYRAIIDSLISKYLPPIPASAGSNYQVFFIDSRRLTGRQDLLQDCALFQMNDNTYMVQGSDIIQVNNFTLLRIYFSNDYQEVSRIEAVFNELANTHPQSDLPLVN
jgi:hypothetical protein